MKSIVFICFLLILDNVTFAQTKLEIPLSKFQETVILSRLGYTLSYDVKNNLPNWVAWTLDKKKLD